MTAMLNKISGSNSTSTKLSGEPTTKTMTLLSLAIETSGRNHSVAVSAAGKIMVQTDAKSFLSDASAEDGPQGPSSSSLLMPMIQSVFTQADVQPRQIGLISVTNGPGSFTGLRVGVVTAKTLAFSLDCPLVAVDTLRACAIGSAIRHRLDVGRVLKTVINAQRGQLFAASFQVTAGAKRPDARPDCVSLAAPQIVDPKQWVSELNEEDFLTGPGLKMAARQLEAVMGEMPKLAVEEDAFRDCDVATVAAIGEQKFHAGELDSAWNLKPVYFRPSAAEEVRRGK